MDVRFCEGRNHRREARVRAAGSDKLNSARSSEARLRRIFFSLTKTYMDVGKRETDNSNRRLPVWRSHYWNRQGPFLCNFIQNPRGILIRLKSRTGASEFDEEEDGGALCCLNARSVRLRLDGVYFCRRRPITSFY